MAEISTREKIFNYLSKELAPFDNNYDRLVYPNINQATILDLKRFHNLGNDVKIIYYRDISPDKSALLRFVISDIGISYRQSYKVLFFEAKGASWDYTINWEEINRVEYSDDKKAFFFYTSEGYDSYLKIPRKEVIKKEDTSTCIGFAEILTHAANIAFSSMNFWKLLDEDKYDEALKAADEVLKEDPNFPDAHFAKGRALALIEGAKDDYDEDNLDFAISELKKAIDLYGDDADEDGKHAISCCYTNIGYLEVMKGNDYNARNNFILSLENCDKEHENDIRQYLEETEEELKETWDNYTSEIQYKDRKFIMPVKDREIGGCYANGITVFRMSNIPSCFTFPTGHPIANQLYIGHPYNPSLYVPLEASEDLFFIDKVHELCYLLECLGAEKISITSIKGKNVTEFNEYNINVAANGDIKLFSGEAERSKDGSKNNEYSSRNQRTIKIKLDPLKKPYVPDGLIWYSEQPQWQRLVESRLNGNMLEYNEFVSNSQTKFISSTEIQDIKASARYLWIKVHGEVETNEKVQFKETEDTQWKVDVKFRSIREFSDGNNEVGKKLPDNNNSGLNQLSEAENSYAEEVRFCISEGEIGEREHRFLNRMRLTLGLSEERAAQIESMLTMPQLLDNEKEYLEAVKDELTDNVIPEKSKKLLNRLRMSLDISIGRAKELESMALNG